MHRLFKDAYLLVYNCAIWTNRDQRTYRRDWLCATTQQGAIGGGQDLDLLVQSDVSEPSPVVGLHNEEDPFNPMV